MEFEPYLESLLTFSNKRYHLPLEIQEAFRDCPRHKFIQENYSLEEMYGDHPLGIYQDENFLSTISQPSFVLLILKLLDIKPGNKILELGAGSGWNAGLMSRLTGPTGLVVSIEIIPKLALATKNNLAHLGFENVKIIHGDGTEGYAQDAPYDRGIFTAGATDLPMAFHDQMKVGSKLIFVLKTSHDFSDLLIVLEKKQDHFESLSFMECQFVPVKGERVEPASRELDEFVEKRKKLKIYPNRVGESLPSGKKVVRKDSVFCY